MASLATCLLFVAAAMAQDFKVSVGGQLHLSQLNIDSHLVNDGIEPGAGLEVGLNYALSDQWSVNTGVGVAWHQSRTSAARITGSENTQDLEGENFRFDYLINNYNESQKFVALSIPLNLQYESKGHTRFYSRLGASYQILTGVQQQASAQTLTTSGYFDRFNGTLTAPAFAGFGTYRNLDFKQRDFDLNNSINATLELGIKEPMDQGFLYIGAFVEYGLNDINKNSDTTQGTLSFNSSSPTDFIANGNFQSQDNTGKAIIDSARLFITGIKLRYQFGPKRKI